MLTIYLAVIQEISSFSYIFLVWHLHIQYIFPVYVEATSDVRSCKETYLGCLRGSSYFLTKNNVQ